MPSIVDTYPALISFQKALSNGEISPKPCQIHKELSIFSDNAEGETRITYAYTKNNTVTAIAMYFMNGLENRKPYFQVGYAVDSNYRLQGIGKDLLKKSIDEMANGFKEYFPFFYIEAVVSINNKGSIKIAQQIIGGEAEEIIDAASGEKAYRYTMEIKADP